MKKIFLFLSVLTLVFLPVFGANLSDLLETARENGSSFKAVENTYITSMNSLNARNNTSSISFSLSSSSKISELARSIPDATVRVTLPEFSDGTAVSMNMSSKNEDNKYTITPSLVIRKTIDIHDSETDDFSKVSETLQIERAYEEGILEAENNFYKSVVSIMNAESQLKTSEKSLERTKDDYQASLLTGQIQEGSVNDLQNKKKIESAESSLATSKIQLQTLKNSFKASYGIDFEDITEVPEYDLTFDPGIEMNTAMYINYLELQDSYQNYLKSIGEYSTLSLSASVGGPVEFSSGGYSSNKVSLSGETTYSINNLNIGINIESQIGNNNRFTEPVVTISGSWGASKTSSADDSNIRIKYLTAQSNYDSQLVSFNNSVLNMQSKIASYLSKVAQFEIQKQYNDQILKYQTELYELNYISLREYQDAVDNVELDRIDGLILAIEGLQLENEIKILCL